MVEEDVDLERWRNCYIWCGCATKGLRLFVVPLNLCHCRWEGEDPMYGLCFFSFCVSCLLDTNERGSEVFEVRGIRGIMPNKVHCGGGPEEQALQWKVCLCCRSVRSSVMVWKITKLWHPCVPPCKTPQLGQRTLFVTSPKEADGNTDRRLDHRIDAVEGGATTGCQHAACALRSQACLWEL